MPSGRLLNFSDPDGALGGRGINDRTTLGDLYLAGINQSACSPTCGLHQGSPVLTAHRSGCVRRTDCGGNSPRRKKGQDPGLQFPIHGVYTPTAAVSGAVTNFCPAICPLCPPLHAAPTRSAGFLLWDMRGFALSVGHGSILPRHVTRAQNYDHGQK